MINIFISHTPYHVLLSCAVAMDLSNENMNHIFIISDFKDADILNQLLEGWDGSPFECVHLLEGSYDMPAGMGRRQVVKDNASAIKRFVENSEVKTVLVFNDGRPEAQVALHTAKSKDASTHCIYIEDGAEAYNSNVIESRSNLKLLGGKLFYGSWWQHVDVLGTSRWIDSIAVTLPEHVRPELKSRPTAAIPAARLHDMRKRGLPQKYLELLGLKVAEFESIDSILLIAHSDTLKQSPQYDSACRRLISAACDSNRRIGVKYHPRETNGDFLSAGEADSCSIIPQALPAEILYLLNPEKIRLIIGGDSTSLLTAKWLIDRVKVVSLAPLLGNVDLRLVGIFEKLGMQIIRDSDKVSGVFD